MKIIILNKKDKDKLDEINKLYEQSFPSNERKDLSFLLKENQNIGEIYYFTEDTFIGFACLLNCNNICHIIYFVTKETLRNQGYGSKIVRMICEMKSGNRVIVDIEKETDEAFNNEQRNSRKQFYIRNGFKETEVQYRWHEDEYEILSFGGNVTRLEFRQFWDDIRQVDPDLLY